MFCTKLMKSHSLGMANSEAPQPLVRLSDLRIFEDVLIQERCVPVILDFIILVYSLLKINFK